MKKVMEFEELKQVQNLCTCKIAKYIFRIVLYITTFYMQHYGIARFILKQGFPYDCTYVADMYNFLCY